jgi:F-type H+-transporting ATPase subunit gamma
VAGGQERILRGRIRSVQATKKITRAMELIAASRIVKAQQRVAAAVPYSELITEVVRDLSAAGAGSSAPLLAGRETVKNVCYVVLTADRGLCGGFNNNIIKRVGALIADDYSGKEVSVLCLGKKIKDVYKRTPNFYHNEKLESMEDIYADLRFELVAQVADEIMAQFLNKSFDKVVIVYNRFVNAAAQIVETDKKILLRQISRETMQVITKE